ncbi:MAG: hypothetical protein HQL87_09520 [Magnetococcales bacterium]|nr:hypothetical protein [Magnetococcales bacterium]
MDYGLEDADFDNVQVDDLPESAQEVAEVIGLPATITLIRAYGGRRIFGWCKILSVNCPSG